MWHYYPEHYMFSYQLIRILCQSHYGGGEFNECLEAAGKIKSGDTESFHQGWMWQGERVLAEAEKADDEGRKITARSAYLRASNYIRTAEFFLVPQDERKLPTYQKSVNAYRKGMALMANPPRLVEVPFDGGQASLSFMPGYFFQVAGQQNGPLVIMFGGLDSTAEELYYGPASLLNERGISVLVLDGPGQGGALRLNHLHTRYDYNVPATVAFDWAVENLDIDPERIGIMSVSMGGYMAARSAAFEHRFKACAIWGAIYSYYDVWAKRPDNHPLSSIVCHILDVANMTEAREKLKSFVLADVLPQIECPTYISHGGDDRQVPVEHAYKVYEALTCEKYLNVVPADSTGSAHCHVDNFAKAYPMLDWLQEKLGENQKLLKTSVNETTKPGKITQFSSSSLT